VAERALQELRLQNLPIMVKYVSFGLAVVPDPAGFPTDSVIIPAAWSAYRIWRRHIKEEQLWHT
jgi:hypothetical protein